MSVDNKLIEMVIVGLAIIAWSLTLYFIGNINRRLNSHGDRLGKLETGFNGNEKSDELRQTFLKEELSGIKLDVRQQGTELKEMDRKMTDYLLKNGSEMAGLFKQLIERQNGNQR